MLSIYVIYLCYLSMLSILLKKNRSTKLFSMLNVTGGCNKIQIVTGLNEHALVVQVDHTHAKHVLLCLTVSSVVSSLSCIELHS